MDAITSFISALHPYDALPEDERTRVARSFTRSQLPEGQIVYTLDQKLDGLYLVETGAVEITDRNGALVSLLERGHSFGERGLLADGRAVTSARMARTISSTKRARASQLPPYSSRRSLIPEDRNCVIR